MNRAELHDELVRLGSRPVPLPDHDRLEALEERLLREFAAAVPSADPVTTIASARRRRRQVLVAGLTAAAAALATAMVLSRGGETSYEVSAATGAVAMYPDGARRTVQAGDHVPAGGLIRTGPTGGVTIEETTVGADRVILLDEEKITLLPAPPSAPPAEGQPAAPAATATAPATAAPTAAPVTLVPTIAPPAPPPAPAAVNPGPLSLSVTESRDGAQLSWTPTDAATFARYIVVRGTAGSDLLEDIVELPDRQLTAFTDVGATTGVEFCYRVVAVDAEGLPVAESETITFVREGTGSSNEIPPSTTTQARHRRRTRRRRPRPRARRRRHRRPRPRTSPRPRSPTRPSPRRQGPRRRCPSGRLTTGRPGPAAGCGPGTTTATATAAGGDDGWWRDGGDEDWDQDDWG